MPEYIYIIAATVLFSAQFLFTKKYQTVAGVGFDASFFHKSVSPILLILALFIYNGCKIEFSLFSFLLAFCHALVVVSLSIFSIKSLAKGSISNYSLYLLSGGMVIPVIYGLITNDPFGIWKIISILVILLGVLIKYEKGEKTKKGTMFLYTMLFVLNGLVGIIASVHQQNVFSYQTVSAVGFSILTGILSAVIGAVAFIVNRVLKKERPPLKKYISVSPWAIIDGFMNGLGNLLLLLALLKIDPSAQYPIVTGGCILLSAVFGFIFYKEKPDKKSQISIALALLGTILIIL